MLYLKDMAAMVGTLASNRMAEISRWSGLLMSSES